MTVAGGSGRAGFSNPGWWGIDVKVQPYTGSFYVRGDYDGTFTAAFQSASGENLGSVEIESSATASSWTQHNFTLTPTKSAADVKNTFSITYDTTASNYLSKQRLSHIRISYEGNRKSTGAP